MKKKNLLALLTTFVVGVLTGWVSFVILNCNECSCNKCIDYDDDDDIYDDDLDDDDLD